MSKRKSETISKLIEPVSKKPKITKINWTPEEDEILKNVYEIFKNEKKANKKIVDAYNYIIETINNKSAPSKYFDLLEINTYNTLFKNILKKIENKKYNQKYETRGIKQITGHIQIINSYVPSTYEEKRNQYMNILTAIRHNIFLKDDMDGSSVINNIFNLTVAQVLNSFNKNPINKDKNISYNDCRYIVYEIRKKLLKLDVSITINANTFVNKLKSSNLYKNTKSQIKINNIEHILDIFIDEIIKTKKILPLKEKAKTIENLIKYEDYLKTLKNNSIFFKHEKLFDDILKKSKNPDTKVKNSLAFIFNQEFKYESKFESESESESESETESDSESESELETAPKSIKTPTPLPPPTIKTSIPLPPLKRSSRFKKKEISPTKLDEFQKDISKFEGLIEPSNEQLDMDLSEIIFNDDLVLLNESEVSSIIKKLPEDLSINPSSENASMELKKTINELNKSGDNTKITKFYNSLEDNEFLNLLFSPNPSVFDDDVSSISSISDEEKRDGLRKLHLYKKHSKRRISPKKQSKRRISPKKQSKRRISLKKQSKRRISLKKQSKRKISPKKQSKRKLKSPKRTLKRRSLLYKRK
jgi:penicillin-insensitive murein endopeptidase